MSYIGQKLHEVEAWGGDSESLPPGEDYVFLIDEVKQENSSKKGTPQLVLLCKVLEPEAHRDRKMSHRFVVGPESKDGSRKRLRALVDATGIQLDNQGGFDDEALIGRAFMADVISEAYEKKDPVTLLVETKYNGRIQNERPYQPQGTMQGYPGQPQQGGFAPQQPQVPQGGYAPPQTPAPGYTPPGYQVPVQPGYAPPPGYQPPQGHQQGPQGYQQAPQQPGFNGAPGAPPGTRVSRPAPIQRT